MSTKNLFKIGRSMEGQSDSYKGEYAVVQLY